MSPAGASQSEDQQYMDKLKQLSKYIEPLRRMINKIDKNEGTINAFLPHIFILSFSFWELLIFFCCFYRQEEGSE